MALVMIEEDRANMLARMDREGIKPLRVPVKKKIIKKFDPPETYDSRGKRRLTPGKFTTGNNPNSRGNGTVSPVVIDRINLALKAGKTIRDTARIAGCDVKTVTKYKRILT